MLFWLICSALALVVISILVLSANRGGQDVKPAAEFDVQVYRDQLAEVDRDVSRGILGNEDAERVRNEISRRLLAADAARNAKTSEGATAGGTARIVALVLGVGVLFAGSLVLYRGLGAPGYGDLPLQMRFEMAEENRKNRPSQEQAVASLPAPVADPNVPQDYKDLVTKLRAAVASRPDDLKGAQLLARHEMALGNAGAAAAAQERVIALKGGDVSAEDHAALADMMVIAAGGYVSPEAERVLVQALQMDPQNGVARYYSGLMAVQIGRPDVGFRTWSRLLSQSKATDPWVTPVREQIEELAYRAGVDYELPPLPDTDDAPGPTAQDVQAASEMSEADRKEMIAGMVSRLSDRLATQGGAPEEWARLISALVVLERGDDAILIYQEAKRAFEGKPDALAVVRSAARRVGLPE